MPSAKNKFHFRPLIERKNRFRPDSFACLIIVLLCLTCVAAPAAGQSSQATNSVLIRNARVANGEGRPVSATVLVSGGKMTRVAANVPAPVGAIVIDGGGNIITLGADGNIVFRPDAGDTATEYPPKLPESKQTVFADSSDTKPSENSLQSPLKSDFASITFRNDSSLNRVDLNYPQSKKTNFGATRSALKPLADQTQTNQQTAPPQAGNDNLAQKVIDPSAPLTIVTFQDKYVPSLWGIKDHENEFDVQIALPYELGGKANIFRATIPYFTNTPAPERRGVGDVALLNVTVLPQKWGKIAIGPVVSFGRNKGPGVDTFALGPAVGAISKSGKWTYGFLNQNLFSFGGDIKVSQLQPLLAYTFNKKVSIALGDDQFTIDWNKKKFVTAPFSAQVNYIAIINKQPVRFFINAQYNFINEFGQRKWQLTPGFSLILR